MKNIEKIKSLTTEQFAEFLDDVSSECDIMCDAKPCNNNCTENIKEWLEAEAFRFSKSIICLALNPFSILISVLTVTAC